MFLSFLAAMLVQTGPPAAATSDARDPHRPPAGYSLVFADEFDGSGLPDPSRWDFAVEGNATGWGNQEKQHYTAGRPENALVSVVSMIVGPCRAAR